MMVPLGFGRHIPRDCGQPVTYCAEEHTVFASGGASVPHDMGSLIKKRRKRMRKKKHRKMLKRTRAQRQRGK
jgi:hypothetical protein